MGRRFFVVAAEPRTFGQEQQGETDLADISIRRALSQRRTIRRFAASPVAREKLERLVWAAQGITGDEGGRTTPSAHSIHPLHLFVAVNSVDGLDRGMYAIDRGDLGFRRMSDSDLRHSLRKAAIGDPEWFTDAACIVVVCADMAAPARAFAEQKPFGERGARYVYLEAGAAAQNLQLQAVAEDLGCVLVGGFDDEATAHVLGLEAPIAPVVQLCIGYPG